MRMVAGVTESESVSDAVLWEALRDDELAKSSVQSLEIATPTLLGNFI